MSVAEPAEPIGAAAAASYQRLHAHLAFLRLAAAAEALPGLVETARRDRLDLIDALERLLAVEVAATEARRLAGRLHFAALPSAATLADFDFAAQPGVDEALVRELATLRFLDDAGHRVYFTTAVDLVARFTKAIREGRWASCLRFFCGPRLLVIDEFAYARDRVDPDANTALFEVIARRYLRSSTILTSHAGVAAWGERLGDPMLAATLLDRVLHRGIVVAIDGPSFRMRAHQQRSDALRRALGAGARR